MAVKWRDTRRPMNTVLQEFVNDALYQLQANMATQAIWPMEVYHNYSEVNESRKARHRWYSTGEGARSFNGRVLSADRKGGNVALEFSFNDYLRYADLGVGQGTSAKDVERGKKANYARRYTRSWNRRVGHSQRPAIAMEFRHVQSRMTGYLQDFYGMEVQAMIIPAFEGSKIPLFV